MTILFAPEAEDDFRALIEYLAERNPGVAAKLSDRIFAVIDQLVSGGIDGPAATLSTGEVVHGWPIPPVRIYYQRRGDALWIARIYHQARRPIAR